MKRILFVDDEQKILEGLRRMLRSLRHEWEMTFAAGGQEALKQLAAVPFEVVVTDMRMPGMDGSELLAEVMRRYPATVRIILSGQCDRATVLKAVGPAHQFLTKPCDPESLKAIVARACRWRDALTDDRREHIASCVASAPSTPACHAELVAELASASASIRSVGAIVARDPGMAAKIVQLTSTSFFGTPQRCSDPARAAALFDLETFRLLASANVFRPLEPNGFPGALLDDLGERSRLVAAAARDIARCETSDSTVIDDAFLAGLLHDVGTFILAERVGHRYAQWLAGNGEGQTLCGVELHQCGTSHADVGGYLIGLWGLPDPVVEAVAFHHCPQRAADEKFTPLTAVHAANALLGDACCHLGGMSGPLDVEYLNRIGLAHRIGEWSDLCRARQPTMSFHGASRVGCGEI